MIFRVFPAGMFQANCYIIGDEDTREAMVVDPGGDANGILGQLSENNLTAKYIVLTHGHGDHIAAVDELKKATGAKILISRRDEYLICGATKELIPILRKIQLFDADEYIDEGSVINIGALRATILATPGHTPGGITVQIEDKLITGDTLFRGSIGRTDFEFGSFDEIISSIKTKLMVFDDATKVYPGHGPSTTIGIERITNPFLK